MEDGDSSWVFDSLICFLNGPVWNAPLQSFIEEKSLIFEPSDKDDSEYRKVYDEFKNLVDLMLGSYMEDIGITPEQFEAACNNGMHRKLPAQFQQDLFEQIWAANDFEIFKRMMTQKNIELQLQALELIQQKYGITPKLFLPENDYAKKDSTSKQTEKLSSPPPPPSPSTIVKEKLISPAEKQILVEVIKQCEEAEESCENLDFEEISTDKSFLKEEKEMLETALHAKMKKDDQFTPMVPQVIDDAEMKKRQEYLKSQRDKLVALKKQMRKKHLEIEMSNNSLGHKPRPQSAKVAEAILNSGQVQIQPETLKIRKSLAERLRSEVISKTE